MSIITHQRAGHLDLRVMQSGPATEFYITGGDSGSVEGLFGPVAEFVRSQGAHIVHERLFGSAGAMPAALEARAAAYGELDDQVRPTLLAAPGLRGRLLGVQVHAIAGIERPEVVQGEASARGRRFCLGDMTWMTGCGVTGLIAGHLPGDQARLTFERMEFLLSMGGADLTAVARTWIWMDRILAWYDVLNQVRNTLFSSRGLIGPEGRMPASTGIGVSPAGSPRCAIDCFAAWGRPDAVQRHHAAGRQRSAYEYGSAFARSASAITPGGRTIFCSGTAAIDSAGATCHADNIRKQIEMTLENVTAVLRDRSCTNGDVVQAMAYCANPAVQTMFLDEYRPALPWPCLTMIGDVCRDDLLFEVEVTACPGAIRA
jgi:enamine deaminase RidA (YjgF/YER057c/UK114 family)